MLPTTAGKLSNCSEICHIGGEIDKCRFRVSVHSSWTALVVVSLEENFPTPLLQALPLEAISFL
jgi:hypothetical protein